MALELTVGGIRQVELDIKNTLSNLWDLTATYGSAAFNGLPRWLDPLGIPKFIIGLEAFISPTVTVPQPNRPFNFLDNGDKLEGVAYYIVRNAADSYETRLLNDPWRNPRLQPRTASSRLPPVHGNALQGPLKVECSPPPQQALGGQELRFEPPKFGSGIESRSLPILGSGRLSTRSPGRLHDLPLPSR